MNKKKKTNKKKKKIIPDKVALALYIVACVVVLFGIFAVASLEEKETQKENKAIIMVVQKILAEIGENGKKATKNNKQKQKVENPILKANNNCGNCNCKNNCNNPMRIYNNGDVVRGQKTNMPYVYLNEKFYLWLKEDDWWESDTYNNILEFGKIIEPLVYYWKGHIYKFDDKGKIIKIEKI